MELSAARPGALPRPRWRGGRALALLLGLSLLGAAGCAGNGLGRAEMDATLYADCVRSGGIWYGDQQFGGSCQFRGPSR